MQRFSIYTFIALALLSSAVLFSGCQNSLNTTQNQQTTLSEEDIYELPKEELNDQEISGLAFMREEEKLARDVYITLYSSWGQRVFNNISNSEQQHMDALRILFEKYELSDPVLSDSVGLFQNEILAGLYDSLIVVGKTSLVEALKVGALIEEIDILDLQNELDTHVDNQDIILVYSNLLNGSYNHLRAYVKNLSRQGVNYVPVKLSTEVYLDILNN